MHWYLEVLRKYTVFSGRARRKEYWIFVLISSVVVVLSSVIDERMGWTLGEDVGFFSTLYGVAVIVPSIALTVRRLHDTDRSGWWLLLGLIPLIGSIVLLVFMILKGIEGDNRFGPDPRAEAPRW